jgi:GNAT superfamily N-acetyltransferase
MDGLTFYPWRTHAGWDLTDAMVERAYPEFMNHDPVANRGFPLMYEMYPQWQQLAVDGDRPIGFLNSVPLPWNGAESELPQEGWDWAMELATRSPVTAAKVACGIQIVIDPDLHGRGYARRLVSQMRRLAAANGCERLIVPIRPTRKPDYPHESMADYARRTRPDGQPFDPWQRVHVSLGAYVVGPCDRAMVIVGTVAEWESWTGRRFHTSGEAIVPGALAPVSVDLALDRITYVEPNLWLRHDVVSAH